MKEKPLVSIVVPTKNRYFYLKKLIELVGSFESEDIELVIQDNSDDNADFEEYVKNAGYSWIVYNHLKGQIPMSVNSDKAILNSTGKYICFIGDDDGVTRYIVDCVKWMEQNSIEAVMPAKISYYWPDARKGSVNDFRATLHYHKMTGSIRQLDPYKSLSEALKLGFSKRANLPMVYHGVVSREALDRVYNIGGTYFPGSSPDISNGVALSLTLKSYVYIDMPVTISGASKFHGGGSDALKNRVPELNQIAWLLPDAVEKWEPRLPKIGMGESIWADSAIKALRYMGRTDLIESVNYSHLYSVMWAVHKNLRSIILPYMSITSKFKCLYIFVKIYGKLVYKLLLRKLKIKTNGNIIYSINNIVEAESNIAANQLCTIRKDIE